MLLLYASYLNCIENQKHHNDIETSVSVVKMYHCHQKCCRYMGCFVVQQACSEVCTSLKYQSGL